MSHTILIDESNGNGLFAMKNSVVTTTSTATTTASNNSVLASSVSNEDLSQSLSEYTDADESMSAPTEFLAEFLSAVMLKDYKKALKYCKLILQYEPNNVTAKEFYPLILEKLKDESSSESDENYNKSSSSPDNLDIASEPNEVEIEISEPSLNIESDSEEGNCNSNSSVSESDENNLLEASNSNVSSSSSSGGSGATGGSDNTTHSYSSLLLEEDDDASPPPPPPPLQPQILSISSSYKEQHPSPDLDLSNGNIKSTSCSDSESPTEPLTQRLVAILRSKCVPSNST